MSEAEKLSVIVSSVERQEKQLAKVISLLTGNDLDHEDRGIAGEVKDHDKRISKLERVKDKAVWWVAGAIAAGAALYKLIELLK